MEDIELLESFFVELEPLTEGFVGVLLEIHRHGNRYVLQEIASVTGNTLLRFTSVDRELVYAVLAQELENLPTNLGFLG
jgi:hypothetical protein